MIAGDAIHAGARETRAAEDVAAADDDGDLRAHLDELLQLARDALDHGRVDTVIALPHQRLARELHEHAFVRTVSGCVHVGI